MLFRPVDLRPDQNRLLGLLRGEERDELRVERLEHDATFKLSGSRSKLVRGTSPPTLELT